MANIIITDFPYSDMYGKRNNISTKFGGGFRRYYEGMTNSEILNFKSEIDNVAHNDCMLLQWTTCPALDFSIEAMKHFGFNYKTIALAWIKISKEGNPRILASNYWGANLEPVLMGIKGSTKPFRPVRKLLGQIIQAPLREHSRKPDEFYEKVELAFPHLEKIEFFSRENRDNWTCYGNEAGKFDGE